MRALEFDSALLPPAERLPTFRSGASHFQVDPIGDPRAFRVRWRLLKLGDINVIRSAVTPIHYTRSAAMIAADRQDRVAIHYRLSAISSGTLDGEPIEAGPGTAAIWDLTRPLDIRTTEPSELVIVTVPRYLLDEVFAVPSYSCVLPPSPELALAVAQVGYLLDQPASVGEKGAVLLARAVRDLFAIPLSPALRRAGLAGQPSGETLMQRIHREVDADLRAEADAVALADRLRVSAAAIRDTVGPVGGLDAVVERRRLLASYRRLSDVTDATPVALLAWQCGMGDLARFRRRFRGLFGIAPSQCRRGARAILPEWAGAYPVDETYGGFLKR